MEKFMKHLKTVAILFYALLFILCAALLAGNALAEGKGLSASEWRDMKTCNTAIRCRMAGSCCAVPNRRLTATIPLCRGCSA